LPEEPQPTKAAFELKIPEIKKIFIYPYYIYKGFWRRVENQAAFFLI